MNETPSPSQLLIYQSEDGRIRLDVRFEGETVWLTQPQMAELFGTSQQNISLHLQNIFDEGELLAAATHKEILSVRQEGSRQVSRSLAHYNLDAILSVGYRVKSRIATQFRIWATQRLREYIVKGFVLDDERLKHPERPFDYFDELLRRIQDIRTSERRFYQKITDIFATGQAIRGVPMRMADWISKLDSFLTINDRDILTHAGRISHELALAHAEQHYESFNRKRLAEAATQPDDFDRAVRRWSKPIARPRKKLDD